MRKVKIAAVTSSRGNCFLSCGRHSRFLDQGSAGTQKSMREYGRGAAGGGPQVLTRASLRFLVTRVRLQMLWDNPSSIGGLEFRRLSSDVAIVAV